MLELFSAVVAFCSIGDLLTNQCDKDEFLWHRKEVNLLFVDESQGKDLGWGVWWQSEVVYRFLFLHDEIHEKINNHVYFEVYVAFTLSTLCLTDLREANVDCVTLGQYMQPTRLHLKVT